MTFWSRRTILIFLALLILTLLVVRYPIVEHERYQTDSYFIHHLAHSIVSDEMAEWTYHPLSYVGYYPLSYPSGVPFLIAEFSIMSGASIEASILALNLACAVILCLATFLMVRHLVDKPQLAILATYFVILGSRFVDTTYLNGSARGPVVALMILVVAAALRSGSMSNLRLVPPILVLIVGCLMVHHMAILLLLIGTAYVLTAVTTRHILTRLRYQKRAVVTCFMATYIVLIAVLPFFLFDHFWSMVTIGLQGSVFFNFGSGFLMYILIGASSYLNQIGFILVFALAYVFLALKSPRFDERTLLPIFSVAVLVPLFGAQLYISMVISPFVAIMGVLWFDQTMNVQRFRRTARILLVLLIAFSVVHPIWSVNRWNAGTFTSGDQVVVGDQVFNDAAYSLSLEAPVFGTCNCPMVESRLQALSEISFLSEYGLVMVLNGDVSREDVLMGIRENSDEFPRNIYNWYEYDANLPIGMYVRSLMIQGVAYLFEQGEVDGATAYFSTHSRLVVVIDNRWSSSYVMSASSVEAEFPQEVLVGESRTYETSGGDDISFPSYIFYQSDLVSMFLTQLPVSTSGGTG